MSILPLGDAVTMFSLYPSITVFLSRIVLKEPLSSSKILAAFLGLLGAVLISQPGFIFHDHHQKKNASGYLIAIICAFLASGVVTLIRKAGTVGAHTLHLLFSWAFFGAFFSGSVGMVMEDWVFPRTAEAWLPIIGIVTIGSSAGAIFNFAGKLVPASLTGISKASSEILFSYLWEVLIFRGHPTLMTYIGIAFAISSLISVAMDKIISEFKRTKNKTGTLDVTTEKTPLVSDRYEKDYQSSHLQEGVNGELCTMKSP